MGTVPLKILGAFLLAGALPLIADDAGRAAAKAYAHASSKSAAAKPPVPKDAPSVRPAETAPGPGRMQVEEPSDVADPEANASKAWQKSHPKGLTDAQKAAFRERKDNMEGMIALIKAKRQALREAKPEERAAIARELHVLILEKDGKDGDAGITAAARVDDKAGAEAEVGTRKQAEPKASAEAQAQRREELRERQSERRKARKARADSDD